MGGAFPRVSRQFLGSTVRDWAPRAGVSHRRKKSVLQLRPSQWKKGWERGGERERGREEEEKRERERDRTGRPDTGRYNRKGGCSCMTMPRPVGVTPMTLSF